MDHEIQTAFDTLGLATTATLQELESAYKDLAQVWHPDRFQHNARLRVKAQRQFCSIREAYDIARSYVESGRPNDRNSDLHDENPQQAGATIKPSFPDLAILLKNWFLALLLNEAVRSKNWLIASEFGAGPISVCFAWSICSFILIGSSKGFVTKWGSPAIIIIFLLFVLAILLMSRLTTAISTRAGQWSVRFVNITLIFIFVYLINEHQNQLIEIGENRLRLRLGRLIDPASRTDPDPLLVTIFQFVVILLPVITWTHNPFSIWTHRCELWLTSGKGLPPWVIKKLPLFVVLSWFAFSMIVTMFLESGAKPRTIAP